MNSYLNKLFECSVERLDILSVQTFWKSSSIEESWFADENNQSLWNSFSKKWLTKKYVINKDKSDIEKELK